MKRKEAGYSIREFVKVHPVAITLLVALFTLPAVISFVQWKYAGVLPMTAGDMIVFYGTAGSIVWAIGAFVLQKEDEVSREKGRKREREEKLLSEFRPCIALKIDGMKTYCRIELINCGMHGIRDVIIWDRYLTPYIKSEDSIVVFVRVRESKDAMCEPFELQTGIDIDSEVSEDGYPETVTVSSTDLLGNSWLSIFSHQEWDGQHIYFFKLMEWAGSDDLPAHIKGL